MAKTYKTPGVYVEEISSLAPSVTQVATAVPAFFGYTENHGDGGPRIVRVDTLLEYESAFGGARPTDYTVDAAIDGENDPIVGSVSPAGAQVPDFLMHYAMRHYFANGGGSCYIVSIGGYGEGKPQKADFLAGLELLAAEDEPTLLVLTDAVRLSAADYYEVCQAALSHCAKLADRFAILDVRGDDDVRATGFRSFPSDDFDYGAAYYPDLQSTFALDYDESRSVTVRVARSRGPVFEKQLGGIIVSYAGDAQAPKVKVVLGTEQEEPTILVKPGSLLEIRDVRAGEGATEAEKLAESTAVHEAWQSFSAEERGGFDIRLSGVSEAPEGTGSSTPTLTRVQASGEAAGVPLSSLARPESDTKALYHAIKARLDQQRAVLPPSAAVAGVYARVDRDRGVWKAPANVALMATVTPTVKVTERQQDDLNVDPTNGKSINVIRDFTGRGTLVWGARTLMASSNEWRYVSVRRLFIMIEESARKSSAFAVFEANDATTWLKVKGMIESFLYGLWERGALAGPTPESAYFVDVGLGKTMTPDDVLNGRMIVRIGVAAVRPAEFIILEFTHKLQEA